MLRALIMDKDGTLVDSERELIRLWDDVSREMGFVFAMETMVSTVGTSAEATHGIMEKAYPQAPHDAIRREVGRRYAALIEAGNLPLRPGARQVLEAAKDKGLAIGLCTSSPRPVTESVLAATDLARYFDATVCAGEPAHHKPHPAPYLLAAQRLGIPPQACLAVEDSPSGARSALGAGMRVIVVPDLIPAHEELAGQVTLCKDLMEVVRLL